LSRRFRRRSSSGLAKGLARLLLLADPVAERDRLVVVSDQRLGAELVEPLEAFARETAAVQEVTGEDQPVAPLAESRAAQRVLEQLRVAVHVRHDQRERSRRSLSAGLHHLAVLHADHMPAPPAVRPRDMEFPAGLRLQAREALQHRRWIERPADRLRAPVDARGHLGALLRPADLEDGECGAPGHGCGLPPGAEVRADSRPRLTSQSRWYNQHGIWTPAMIWTTDSSGGPPAPFFLPPYSRTMPRGSLLEACVSRMGPDRPK